MKRTTSTPTETTLKKTADQQDANIATEPQPSNVLDFGSTLRELRRTVDPNLIRQRAGRRDREGNLHMVEYVEWHTVADILDEHASNWSHSVKDIRAIGDIITVTVAITIDGITREGIGTGRTASETGIKKAEHDALKRAAVKFGIARELYRREFESGTGVDDATTPTQPARALSPMAQSLGDLVTTKQLGMIRALGRENGVDVDHECNAVMGCGVTELSKRAASEFIDRLNTRKPIAAHDLRRAG